MDKGPFSLAFMPSCAAKSPKETLAENFHRILSTEAFIGLKAILNQLSHDGNALYERVQGTTSFEELLHGFGYRLVLTNQIHVQDCYSRLSPAGGIKAVLPYFDIPTHSALPVLVNVDSTVTATYRSAAFFNEMFAALKAQLRGQN